MPEKLRVISHDPFENPQCRACELLPTCLGNCDWERRTDRMQCHPLKTTLPDYLRDLRRCYPQPATGFLRLLQGGKSAFYGPFETDFPPVDPIIPIFA